MLEEAVLGIITIDAHGLIRAANPAAERLFGHPAAELVGRNVSMLMPAEHATAHDGYLARYLQTGEKRIIGIGREIEALRKDGTTFPAELAVSEVRIGAQRFFTGLIHDITARKQAETELRRHHDELDRLVAERTAELARTATALTRSNEELQDFADIVSHDLKEPLRGISHYSRFLLADHGDRLGDEGRGMLETLQRLSSRLQALVDSLLEYSRVGRVELATGPTDLDGIVRDVLAAFEVTLRREGVTITVPRSLPSACCDRIRVAEVFRNLIQNAVRYNESPRKTIEIGYREGEPIVLYVRDNGIGIPPDQRDEVFAVFRRLRRDSEGTGIGLSIARKIVERHGGTIWIEDAPGGGSSFCFTLAPPANPA